MASFEKYFIIETFQNMMELCSHVIKNKPTVYIQDIVLLYNI